MLTYQVRPMAFRYNKGESLTFPAEVEIRFHFQPHQPFGMEPGNGRTAIRAVAATVLFNRSTGAHTIESEQPLRPLDVRIEELGRTVELKGNVLFLRQHFDTRGKLHDFIHSIYFWFPILLNVQFADPPFIERVDGRVGSCAFRWELHSWRMDFRTTTQDQQEEKIGRAWERMTLLSNTARRRLMAALHYLHVACRLARQGSTPGEFLAEVLLNFAKTLEVLFPPTGDVQSREAARAGLRTLGFSEDEIEGSLIPALALRNEIDVGHVELGQFTMEQSTILHAYTERAEGAFRDLLNRVLEGVSSGTFEIPPHELMRPRREALTVIDRLRKYTPPEALQ